jgi:two-component system, OmpR family, phosphate regulon sensor histidine kinase PhoR
LSERKVLQLEKWARRGRLHDSLWIAGAAVLALVGAAALGAISWPAALLIVAIIAVALYARHRWGDRVLQRQASELTRPAAAGLSLATAEALIECLPDPLLLLDEEGRVLFSNAATHGLAGGAAMRRHVSTVLRAPGVLEAVNLVLAGSTAQSVEYSMLVPVERHMLAYVAPIPLKGASDGRDQVGRGAIVVLHELTAQKRLEQMRADFVANASHELRTPLSSLSGFIDTLRGHARDDAAAREKFLEIMHDQAARMRRLIEDLLSLSRIELNEHITPEGRVSLAGVVGDVFDGLSQQAATRKVRLEAEIDDATIDVVGARDELHQVVQNLVDNAIKYGASGGRIAVRVGNAGPGEARPASFVAVQDFGEGIAREHLPRLTERFYRIDVQRSRQTGGTGLGLAIVKHIVNRHRGWLSIESAQGEGSTFTVFLPQVTRAAAAEPPEPAQEPPQRIAQTA